MITLKLLYLSKVLYMSSVVMKMGNEYMFNIQPSRMYYWTLAWEFWCHFWQRRPPILYLHCQYVSPKFISKSLIPNIATGIFVNSVSLSIEMKL